MIFSSNADRRKTNPLIYVKFWRQACLPSILFGAELFTLTPSLLLELERCQSRFLKKLFNVPDFALRAPLFRLTDLSPIHTSCCCRAKPIIIRCSTSTALFIFDSYVEPNLSKLITNQAKISFIWGKSTVRSKIKYNFA